MKIVVALIAACFLWVGTAIACEVEEWNHSYGFGALEIFGVANCQTGFIGIRLYDGEGESRELIGVSEARVSSYVFETTVLLPGEPKMLSVRFGVGN